MKENDWVIDDERVLPQNTKTANVTLRYLNVQKSEPTIDRYRRIIEKGLDFGEKKPNTHYLKLTVLSRFIEFCVINEETYDSHVRSEYPTDKTGCRWTESDPLNLGQ